MVVKGEMSGDYQGPSEASRAGCLVAVMATPVAFFTLFTNFMPDFVMPSGSILLQVLIPAVIVGIVAYSGVKTIVSLVGRNGS